MIPSDESMKAVVQALNRAEKTRRQRERERALFVIGWTAVLAGLLSAIAFKLLGWW